MSKNTVLPVIMFIVGSLMLYAGINGTDPITVLKDIVS